MVSEIDEQVRKAGQAVGRRTPGSSTCTAAPRGATASWRRGHGARARIKGHDLLTAAGRVRQVGSAGAPRPPCIRASFSPSSRASRGTATRHPDTRAHGNLRTTASEENKYHT